MKESEIEAYLVERVEALGGVVRKVRWIGRRKAPDRFVSVPSDHLAKLICLVELKAPDEEPDHGQAEEIDELRRAGVRVEVIDSKEGVDALLA